MSAVFFFFFGLESVLRHQTRLHQVLICRCEEEVILQRETLVMSGWFKSY